MTTPNQSTAGNAGWASRFQFEHDRPGVPESHRSAAMRALLAIACLVVCGCDFSPPANPFSKEVTDKSGTNRLALIYVSTGPGPGPNSESFDFNSLAWRTKVGTNWTDRAVITKADFEASGVRPQWVSDIHSLDARTGAAVIKVAEYSSPQTNGTAVSRTVIYSWREWSMTSNAEARVLRVCKEPFEPFNLSLSYRLRERVINRR